MDYPLHEYAKVLQGFMEREASLPVSGLESLANAGIALHNMIVVQSLDDEYGDRAEHLSEMPSGAYHAASGERAFCQLHTFDRKVFRPERTVHRAGDSHSP